MLKNVQFKIILLFSILGICLILGMGILGIVNMKEMLSEQVMAQNVIQASQIEMQINNIGMITIILLLLYGIASIIISLFMSQSILKPLSKMIKAAPNIIEGEEKQNKKDIKRKKK